MINGKFSYTTELAKKLAESLGKIGIKLNVKAEPWLNVRFSTKSSGPYGKSLWIFIYVWDTGELVTDPILLEYWLAPGAGYGEPISENELESMLKGSRRVNDSVKLPKRGSAKQIIYAKMGRSSEHKPTGKVELDSIDINRYKF